MKRLFEKYETLFCILLIIIYILLNSYCLQKFGIEDYRSTIINTMFSISLIVLINVLKRRKYYGLIKVENANKYLYFIPLILIISVNLWNGISINNSVSEIVFYILNMLNVGFIEEIIFRSFLIKMMAKDNIKNAIIVSSLTFGIGHIINILHGASFIPTLMQIFSAISVGYLFAIIFYKSKSIVPCIITHSLLNALSVFSVENTKTIYLESIFLIIIPLVYAFYINKNIKEY